MNKARSTRWYTPWRSPVVQQDDWADQGTAFGLDMSLSAPTAAAEPPRAKPRSSSWVQRLTVRRRAPA
jgi:hypothetical protein